MSGIDPTVPAGPIAYTADQRANWDATVALIQALQAQFAAGPFLPLDGGQVLGPVLLNADPLRPAEAATKRYVDAAIAAAQAALRRQMQAALDDTARMLIGRLERIQAKEDHR